MPARTLLRVALQVVQADALVQVRQVGEQAVQLTAPLSKKPMMQEQLLLRSLLRGSTQEVQVPVGEEQFWHWVGHFWQVVPFTK